MCRLLCVVVCWLLRVVYVFVCLCVVVYSFVVNCALVCLRARPLLFAVCLND